MKVGDLVRKINHHDVDYLQDLIGWIVEVDHSTSQAGVSPVRVLWSNGYGLLWTLKQNLETVSESR